MGVRTSVACPTCDQTFGLRFDPGPEDAAPTLAVAQLRDECPNHQGGWTFWPSVTGTSDDEDDD